MALRLLLVALLACSTFAFRLPRLGSRVPMDASTMAAAAWALPPVVMMADEPAEDAAEVEAPAPSPPPPEAYETREPFLGVFDVTQPEGALAASVIVSGGFGVLVELVKFLDPNSVGDSIFGSITTIGK